MSGLVNVVKTDPSDCCLLTAGKFKLNSLNDFRYNSFHGKSEEVIRFIKLLKQECVSYLSLSNIAVIKSP